MWSRGRRTPRDERSDAGLASGSTFPVGTTTVTYEVTDATGNTADCSFIVTVNDNEDPTITCPANITVNVDAGTCGAVVTYTPPVGTDNCPGATTAQTVGLGSGSTSSYRCWIAAVVAVNAT